MKKLLFLLLAFMATVAVNAEQVSRQQALQKAKQFMPGKQFGEAKSFARGGSSTDQEPFYIFNTKGQNGYVIVSGDDRTTEILGYSKTGNLDIDQLPENLKYWLDCYARQIEALGFSATPVKRVRLRGNDSWQAIDPLIKTTWNQVPPYNLKCPDYKGRDWRDENFATDDYGASNVNYICVTGCVATAMAQIMYYHKYPATCPAIDAYMTKTNNLSLNALEPTTFNWKLMKESYSPLETGASVDEVAKLMRYCGQAVNMDYTINSSGASVSAKVMAEVFGYSKNIRTIYRNLYSTSQWEEIIYAELASSRPVFYSGQSGSGGHQFVVDGYDGHGFFHMNWGWGGMSDDYFVLSLADPYDQGAGGSTTNKAYQFNQDALIGVQPPANEEALTPQIESRVEPMDQEYTRASAEDDFAGVHFYGTVFAHYNFPSTEGLNLQVGWALCQNGQIKQVVSEDFYSFAAGNDFDGQGTDSEVTFGAGMALGKYEICQVYRFTQEATWNLCTPYYYTSFYVAELTETTLNVRGALPSFKVNSMAISEYPAVGISMDVTANVTNDGETFEQVLKLWAQKQGESSWSFVATATRRIDPGMSGDIVFSYKPTAAGIYTLKVTNSKSADALMAATVTVYASVNTTINNVTYLCNTGSQKAVVVGNTYSSNTAFNAVIPATFDIDDRQYTVTEIADDAFYQCFPLISLSIPATVESIGDYAVYNCYSLSEIKILEGVKHIGESAFKACHALTSVSLPSTILSIGNGAFGNDNKLQSVVVAMDSPCQIDKSVFVVEKIVDGAYVEAFTSADLYVPIGKKAVYTATDVWKDFSTMYQGELKEKTEDGITYVYVTGEDFAIVKKGDKSILQYQDVVIPSTIQAEGKIYKIKRIENKAFIQIPMNSLTIQPGLEEIGSEAFWNVNGVKDFDIPASVKRIGAEAFQYCFSAKTVKLPASLTNIDDYAFGNMTSLTSVVSYIPIPVVISSNVFGVLSGSTITAPTATLTVPYNAKSQYEAAEGWRDFPNIVEMEPSGLGDANGDGDVNESDIQTIADHIMGKNPPGFNFNNANINGDTKVDAADLVELINIIKSLQAKYPLYLINILNR